MLSKLEVFFMRKRHFTMVAIFSLLLASSALAADLDIGGNINWDNPRGGGDTDWGLSGRLDWGEDVRLITAFDYYFREAEDLVDEGNFVAGNDLDLKFWELNANVVYQFPTQGVKPYFGGGLGIARRTFNDIDNVFDDERTELGFNAIGGLKFPADPVTPFVEARGTFYGDDDENDPLDDFGDRVKFRDRFVMSAGILF
jgi:opacity protein-like surface antigen